jgi:localization factor PodJL
MRPDLPWSVAGISGEAREAARAAARREGLSVGEWLTRRIVSELSDMSETLGRSEWTSRAEYRPQPERQKIQSDAMLEHVARSESETADVYRRIEDQLRGVARRLEASERSQTENNRVMSKAAVEMNIAAREQAQAFDQLGAHVTNIAERLDQVEGRDPGDGLRDAVKALHQGLSRLADQISQTANQSAAQISSLANNLETVAGRVGQARQDAIAATQTLESRLGAIDERVRTLETATHANAGSIERALDAIEAQKRMPSPMEAIVRLEDNVRRLDERGSDPAIDRRLMGIERTLSDVMDRVERREEPSPAVEDNLRKVVGRLESLEAAHRETAAELRKAAVKSVEVPPPPAPEPPPPQAAAAPSNLAAFGPLAGFEPPPFAAAPPLATPAAPPPFAAAPPPFAAAPPPFAAPPSFADPLPNNYDLPPEPGYAPAPTTDAAFTAEAPSTVESYLAAARRSARAAAEQEAERNATLGGLRWGSAAKPADHEAKKRTRPLLVGLVALLAIFVIAAAFLSRMALNPNPLRATVTEPATKPAPARQVEGQLRALPPTPQAAPSANSQANPKIGAPAPLVIPPAQVASTAAAKPTVAPTPAQMVAPARPAPAMTPLDRLTQAANAGNARAQLIVGLKYLNGDGVPANEAEAVKWLTKAADAGEPVAQYRVGTLFERGHGVAPDPVKAVRWYLAAANQGSCKAMHNLAVAYAEGTGVKKDYAEASRWFLRAANLGLSDSQFNLAVLYERGLGVPQNLVDAYKWYAIAASQGDTESKARITAIISQLDPEARAAAQHAADSFRPGQLNARANVAPTMADATRG